MFDSIFHFPFSIFHFPFSIFHFPFSIFHFPFSIFFEYRGEIAVRKLDGIFGTYFFKDDMDTLLAPKTVQSTKTSEYDYRVLYLSGSWSRPGSEFRLRATIYIQKDGAADGAIYWRAVKSNGTKADYFATESVRGFLRQNALELDGVEVEEGLIPDSYRVTLAGAGEAGTFGGITKTCLLNWCGSMDGSYVFRNRKS